MGAVRYFWAVKENDLKRLPVGIQRFIKDAFELRYNILGQEINGGIARMRMFDTTVFCNITDTDMDISQWSEIAPQLNEMYGSIGYRTYWEGCNTGEDKYYEDDPFEFNPFRWLSDNDNGEKFGYFVINHYQTIREF